MNQDNTVLVSEVLETAHELFTQVTEQTPYGISFGDAINAAVGIQRNRILQEGKVRIDVPYRSLSDTGPM